MTSPFRRMLEGGVAAMCLMAALPAWAQQDAAATGATEGVEDIVVSARLRNERIQDIPVTAFSAQSIADRKIEGASDFLSSTPNVSINQSQSAGVSFITIRGVSQVRNGESPVAVVIDGVQQVTSRQLTQELFDLERIEVLRGPQGALYGRNAIGGAIVITTKEPSEELEGSASAGYGRGEDYRVRGSVSGPLAGEALRFRVSGAYRDLGGYYRNVYLDKKVDGSEDLNLRGQLFAQLGPDFTADLKAQYGRTEGGGGNFQYQSANFDPARPCFLDPANPFGGPAPDANRVSRTYCATNLGYNLRTTGQVSLRLQYDAGFATITNVTAYDKVKEISRATSSPTPPASMCSAPTAPRPNLRICGPGRTNCASRRRRTSRSAGWRASIISTPSASSRRRPATTTSRASLPSSGSRSSPMRRTRPCPSSPTTTTTAPGRPSATSPMT
jgi:iron complex outermembrane recepter protein